MNREEMKAEIEKHVRVLVQRDKDCWKEAEELRECFVKDYSVDEIPDIALDEYVIGKGNENLSFCYRIERKMDLLGRITGARADRFGIYYGRIKSDSTDKYRFTSIWGKTPEAAFLAVKQAIVALIIAGTNDDMEAIQKNKLSPIFKGKLLHIYHPTKFAPIYSIDHLAYFVAQLDISGTFRSEVPMQKALMDYRATWPKLVEQPIPLFMRFLYDFFGHPPDENSPNKISHLPLLDEAVKGTSFINTLPVGSPILESVAGKSGKTDFEKRAKELNRIGQRGEAIVIELEKKRLIQAGKAKLAERIEQVSLKEDGLGFDILSFENDGTELRIEVKATSASNLERGFYISRNELECSSILENYCIYLVFSTMSKSPRIFQMKQPMLKGEGFDLEPMIYRVMPKFTVSETVS